MLDRYGTESFIIFAFSRKMEKATIRSILLHGVITNGQKYNFLGCSSSGLKGRTCYMLKGSLRDVNRVLKECGSFSSIKSRYKRLKRIALLFSSATPTRIEIPESSIIEEPDIESGGHIFTDGCGAVCKTLADEVRKHCLADDYQPSVYQIRYQGCKGVVIVDHHLERNVQLVIRPSMKKFDPGTNPFKELWLCDHSRPYTFGHLNRQFITLLSSLGVKDKVFLRIQDDYFQRLESILHDPEAAFEMLLFDNQPDIAFLCTHANFLSSHKPHLSKLKTKLVSKLEKLRLPMLKSRNVFGVSDPTGTLEYGQCYFRYTKHGEHKTLHGRVMVAKNPCYLLGDVRVLTAVVVKGLDHLYDCLVFPTRGKRPHPSEIAGSDLDGDQYFVSWDEELVVLKVEEPYNYPSEDVPETSGEVSHETLIDYFASQRNNMGKIDSYYKYWANKKGAACSECQSLGQLFSRSVDATKTGDVVAIPPNLKPPLEVESSQSEDSTSAEVALKVWEEMEKRATEKKQTLSEDIVCGADVSTTIDEDFVWSLLEHKVPNLSEFQLLRLIQLWCSQQSFSDEDLQQKLLDFSKYINFGELTTDQQVQAIDAGIPLKSVTNALNQSTLPDTLLEKFILDDPHSNWRFYFYSSSADFNWSHLLRGLQRHPESMIIINLQDYVTFVLHFLSPPSLGETDIGAGSVVAYFSSSHFNLDLQCVLGSEFKLILDDEKLQLFRGNIGATFIWLSNERPSKAQGRKIQDTLFDRISVDLTSFKNDVLRINDHPTVNKQSFLSIEMFVKTTNFQPAYMDITEADVQDDYPVEEAAATTDDIEDLPKDFDEEKDTDALSESLHPYSQEASLAVLDQSAKKGFPNSFRKTLETILSNDDGCAPQLLPYLQELLRTMAKKYCHMGLSDEARHTLQAVITSLHPCLTAPLDLLELISRVGQLGCYSLMDSIVDSVLPNLHTREVSEYFSIIRQWQLWYFLPPSVSVRLSQHFYTLYTSLCDQSSIPQRCPPQEQDARTSITDSELIQLATSTCSEGTVQQDELDRYTSHFSHLVFGHLLCEIFTSQDLCKQSCDTSSSLVRMSCYDYKNPHFTPSERDDNEEEEKGEKWIIGFNRPIRGILSKNFTVGSYVAINLMKKSSSEVVSVPVTIGRIIRVSRNPADIVTEISEPVPISLRRSAECRQGHWQLALVGNVTSFNRSLRVLTTLREVPHCNGLLPLLVHSQQHEVMSTEATGVNSERCTDSPEPFVSSKVTTLNNNQQKAVFEALRQRLTLIHGPPGTGKTHVACEIVQQELDKNKQNPILVVAETNLAVDNLCEKLTSQGIRVVRIGRLDHVTPPLRSISLEGQIEKKRIQEGKDKQRSSFPDKKVAKPILNAAQVVAATCTSSGDPILKGMKFPFVIMDEATQVTEPTSLIPLQYGCQQLTLIGDPEQLAPSLPNSIQPELSVKELSVSLFHRLQKALPSTSIFLNEQHRMHPKLAEFPSQKFYGGKLLTAKRRVEMKSIFQESIPILAEQDPRVFVRVSEREKRKGTSFCNPAEARAVTKVILHLINHKVTTRQIAILTPYTGQLKCIQEECQKERIQYVKLHTIDSFQGREADVIIFSAVRCNPTGELGFVNDKYRMNVLLTRARHGVIGIGCDRTLSTGSQLWKEWLENVKIIDESGVPFIDKPHGKRSNRSHTGGRHRGSGGANHSGQPHVQGTKQGRHGQSHSASAGHSDGNHQSPDGIDSSRRRVTLGDTHEASTRRGGHHERGQQKSRSSYRNEIREDDDSKLRENVTEEHSSIGAPRARGGGSWERARGRRSKGRVSTGGHGTGKQH